MSKSDLYKMLNKVSEITLSVKGRKSGKNIPRPVWCVHEGNQTNWYKNFLVDPTLKISANDAETTVRGKPITDSSRVDNVVRKFKSKYGGDVKKYYPKTNAAVEVPL